MARRRALLGYVFLLPTFLGILVFSAGPVIVSLGLSFFAWNVFDPPEFLALDNYLRFFSDGRILIGFSNTAKMVSLAVIIEMVLAFALALGVQRTTRAALRYFFRSAFFLPLLTSAATISIVMAYMFHSQFGVINYYLGLLGVPRIPWLEQAQWALLSVVLVYVWHRLGFTFIVFSGGLGNLPKEVLEAADVDGATGWRRLWYIVLPMLSPSILFAAVTAIISGLQIFDEPFVMVKGGPGDATRTVVMLIYESAFKNIELGYAAAIAAMLFLVIMLVTAIQFRISKALVFYQ
ncbi:MAG: sugar ABC transporter permease [Chloroflexi bacterium]|nr:MAG: sugar ABC transporter permease [Chloroflexota bacterium]